MDTSMDRKGWPLMDAKCALRRDRKSLILFYPKVSISCYLFTSNRDVTLQWAAIQRFMVCVVMRDIEWKHRCFQTSIYRKDNIDVKDHHRYRKEISIYRYRKHRACAGDFLNLFPNFEVRVTYNTRFKDKLQREQKHRHRNFISIFYTSTSVRRYRCKKNIDNRKQTSMFSMFWHRCPITRYVII